MKYQALCYQKNNEKIFKNSFAAVVIGALGLIRREMSRFV